MHLVTRPVKNHTKAASIPLATVMHFGLKKIEITDKVLIMIIMRAHLLLGLTLAFEVYLTTPGYSFYSTTQTITELPLDYTIPITSVEVSGWFRLQSTPSNPVHLVGFATPSVPAPANPIILLSIWTLSFEILTPHPTSSRSVPVHLPNAMSQCSRFLSWLPSQARFCIQLI